MIVWRLPGISVSRTWVMRRVLYPEPIRSDHHWLVRCVFAAIAAAALYYLLRDPNMGSGPLTGLGELRVLGVTEGREHVAPGRAGMIRWLPGEWRKPMARQLGYRGVVWNSRSGSVELQVWCEWNLTNTLAPGGWFEPVLIDKSGQTIAVGSFPEAGCSTGRSIEPVGFRPLILPPGTVFEVHRFQPGSPRRDTVAHFALAGL